MEELDKKIDALAKAIWSRESPNKIYLALRSVFEMAEPTDETLRAYLRDRDAAIERAEKAEKELTLIRRTALSPGLVGISIERQRQIEKHEWTAEHDDEHDDGQLAMAASCYAASAANERIYVREEYAAGFSLDDPFPWDNTSDARPYNGNVLKCPTDEQAIRLLEKAGALIAAEIDRLLRAKKDLPGPF